MEWLVPVTCLIAAMLGCTGIITIDLKGIRRELESRPHFTKDESNDRTKKRSSR